MIDTRDENIKTAVRMLNPPISAVSQFIPLIWKAFSDTSQLLQKALILLAKGCHCGGGTLISFDSQLPFFARSLVGFWTWISKTGELAAGSFIFCLARGFHDIGGFDEQVYAGEEVFFSRRIRAWGKRHNMLFTIIADKNVITSGRKFRWYSSIQIAMLLILFTVFPFALRNRSLCSFWYRRPDQ